MLYGIFYGLERMVVEGMRTDSLYIGHTTIRVSQALSAAIVVAFTIWLVTCLVKLKKGTLSRGYLINPPELPFVLTEVEVAQIYNYSNSNITAAENEFFTVNNIEKRI